MCSFEPLAGLCYPYPFFDHTTGIDNGMGSCYSTISSRS